MSQSIRIRKLIARFLKWRKGAKARALSGCVGCVDEVGTISFRPRVLCRPELAGHRTVFKTLTT